VQSDGVGRAKSGRKGAATATKLPQASIASGGIDGTKNEKNETTVYVREGDVDFKLSIQ
jgi:hypothetical protein